MAQTATDPVTGARYVMGEDGNWQAAPEAGLLAQAGRQLTDIGGGIQQLFGADEDRIRSEAAERNRLFAGTDMADPVTSFAGQALPALATLPLSAGGVAGNIALNTALAAGEGALDVGQGGTAGGRALSQGAGGMLGAIGGDVMSRMAGRVSRGVSGLMQDIQGRKTGADNPIAKAWEDIGGTTTAGQRMKQGTDAQRAMRSLEEGLETNKRFRGLQAGQDEVTQEVLRGSILEGVGMPKGAYNDLGTDTLGDVNARFTREFSDNATAVANAGTIDLPEELAKQLQSQGQIPDLMRLGKFKGLSAKKPTIAGQAWLDSRKALSESAAKKATDGYYSTAEVLFEKVDELDNLIEGRLPSGQLEKFRELREQYRVFQIALKRGVIKSDGTVSAKNLNSALQSGTGFGDTARFGLKTGNKESKNLIDAARIASDNTFNPLKSSGTTENLRSSQFLQDIVNPAAWPGVARDAAGAAAVRASALGDGNMATGFTGSGGMGGGILSPKITLPRELGTLNTGQMPMGIGRAALDQALFPFVGTENDIPNQ